MDDEKDFALKQVLFSYLKCKVSFENLLLDYYDAYFDSELENSFHSDICEKLDFTTNKHISSLERRYGWITDEEFKNWLSEKMKSQKFL